jgi:hypothetical protein
MDAFVETSALFPLSTPTPLEGSLNEREESIDGALKPAAADGLL